MVCAKVLFQWSVLIFILKLGESCDGSDWIQNDGNCYKIFTDSVPKDVAESTCLEHRSALASISNVVEHSFLVTKLSETNTSEENFWIGLHKIGNELQWNNRAPAGNLPWIDSTVSSLTDSSDCFIFNSAKVLPFNCSATASFVCEQWKILGTTPVSCPPGTHRNFLSDKCFWYTHMPLSKAGSEVICSLKYGRLLVPRGELLSINIGMLLMLVPPPRPIMLWTSLMVRNGSFLFEDGTEFSHEDFTLRRGDGECVALVTNRRTTLELHQKPCSDQALGLCESNVDSVLVDLSSIFGTRNNAGGTPSSAESCPVGSNWQEHDETGFCYWETSYETARLSWEDARKYCQSYGGDLASFQSREEERIGLGFQFGSVEHAYWIGLHYDTDTDNYIWADGSPMNYSNWDDGQPNHADRRMRCGYMSSLKKKWLLSYCGMLSWFICKAPKQINPPVPVTPTSEPLTTCPGSDSEYFFQDYCYKKMSLLYGWHRAQQYCENQQGNLVSLHSEDEVDFLIRFLASSEPSTGNRIWIGLNSLGLGGAFKWTDGSPVDFTNWDIGEPNNFQNQEKCANMYKQHGMWNDENCNAVMNFVCKRRNGTYSQPSTTTSAPVTGYCPKDWYMFGDRCFKPVGLRKSDRKNWTEAQMHCFNLGGYLLSIRDVQDQAFIFYLIQTLKMDTWIGLHDSIHSGNFFWLDNSPLFYNNWAPGEPSSYGFQEDCVVITYGNENAGKWKDTQCQRQLPYICQTHRDPSITKPNDVRGTRCPHLPDYMKQDTSCYKLFPEPKTWEEAQSTCRRDGAYLVSISDMEKQAVVSYLAAMYLNDNETFWIGLKNTGKYPLQWENSFPLAFTKWARNEPRLNPRQNASCYHSTIPGYWAGELCSEKKAFVCHFNADKPPTSPSRRKGPCPDDKSSEWRAVGNSCMQFSMKSPIEWYSANFFCSTQGSYLASFHSMEELNAVNFYLGSETKQPMFIGLVRNSEGGFQWVDRSPVDFVNWEQDEPGGVSYGCVEMRLDTMKWRATGCSTTNHYVCAKEREVGNSTDSESNIALEYNESHGLHPGVVVAIVIAIIILVAVAGMAFLRYRASKSGWNRYRVESPEPIRSFENQTFDELNSMDIHERNIFFAKD